MEISSGFGARSTGTGTGWTASPLPGPKRAAADDGRCRGRCVELCRAGVSNPPRYRRARDPEAPDIDQPLLQVVEDALEPLLAGGFTVVEREYDEQVLLPGRARSRRPQPTGDPLIVILATRNAAVDDAHALVERLTETHDLPEGVLTASTVDKWQGQTNRITIAVHPLSGADQLDDFNSAFGRLAVSCTRATHGLLLVTRVGIRSCSRPCTGKAGTPLGEPGTRTLPRQTHQRILAALLAASSIDRSLTSRRRGA